MCDKVNTAKKKKKSVFTSLLNLQFQTFWMLRSLCNKMLKKKILQSPVKVSLPKRSPPTPILGKLGCPLVGGPPASTLVTCKAGGAHGRLASGLTLPLEGSADT